MRPTTYITLIYGILVLLSGVMGMDADRGVFFIYFETIMGSLFLINILFMRKKKTFSEYIALIFGAILTLYFGFLFAISTSFFPGLLCFIGLFIIILHLIRIFGISTVD